MGATAIGPYQVVDVLDRGGMSVVYRARHVGSGRAVALKTVDVPSPRLLESLRREIRALDALNHPGVVKILDHGLFAGRPWYAMELIEGESLRQLTKRFWLTTSPHGHTAPTTSITQTLNDENAADYGSARPAARTDGANARPGSAEAQAEGALAAAGHLDTALDLVRRVCMALAYLHGEGFVNRDLKPDNILVVEDHPIIIDFGLTALHPKDSAREELQYQGAMVGTLPYMSPEQIRGEFADARGDLYAVGCVLYELVVGRVPFEGSPREIVNQHLSATPVLPSSRVRGVPPALDRLLMKLLAKHPQDRPGYAEDVALELSSMVDLPHPPPDLPPCRPYLYRPRFVGRETVLKRLAAFREQALAGAGCFVLVGGESGIGKTRLGMEVTRTLASWLMNVVTSESHSFAPDGHPIGQAPLHVVRPILQAVADCCQEGGAPVTEELLGPWQSLLSLYEPLLRHAPSTQPMVPVPLLSPNASRRRLFTALRETIAAFARMRPVLWILDDVHWADELSLAFLNSLEPTFLEATPLFILGLYRKEGTNTTIEQLCASPSVEHIELGGLERGAIGEMMQDMLASEGTPNALSQLVAERSNGSPFVASNFLTAAVSKGAVFRDTRGCWQLRPGFLQADSSLRDVLDSAQALAQEALTRLSPTAREVALAIAILGRNAEHLTVQQALGLPVAQVTDALAELARCQLVSFHTGEHLRFQHDKFREAVYAAAEESKKRALHKRAALLLSVESTDHPGPRDPARIAYHQYAAGEVDSAVTFLQIAAERARAAAAYADAANLYQTALDYTLADAAPSGETPLLFTLYESLGDARAHGNRREAAREAYNQALFRSAGQGSVARARLYRKLGVLWGAQHEHTDATRHYDLALAELGDLDDNDPAAVAEWIDVHVDCLWGHYFRNDVVNMEQVICTLDPAIRRHGTTLQQARFTQCIVLRNFRRDRYLVSEETLRLAQHALALCKQGKHWPELPLSQLMVGIGLVLQRSHRAADEQLQPLLALAREINDRLLESRCLTYLSLAARMRQAREETQTYTLALARAAGAAELVEYIAAARANEAWLAFHDGDMQRARHKADDALELWNLREFPFKWMAALPLLHVYIAAQDLTGCVRCVEILLDPSQQLLPGAAADALGLALMANRQGDTARTMAIIERGCQHLTSGGYR